VLAGAAGAFGLGALVATARPGLGVGLLGGAVWVAAVPTLVRRRAWSDLALAAGSIALLAVVALRASAWVGTIAALAALAAAVVASTGARSVLAVLAAPASWTATAVRALPWLSRGLSQRISGSGRTTTRTGLSILVAALLALVFGSLFASADPTFARLLPRVRLDQVPQLVVVGGFWAAITITITHAVRTPPPGARFALRPSRRVALAEWLIPMLTLSALVWVFVLVQLSGARALLTGAGPTYADSAHQGFGQLVAATALTPLVAAIAAQRAPRGTPAERRWTSGGIGALSVGMLGVVASALHRLDLYVAQYGLSELRVMAGWAELVLGAVLALGLVAGLLWKAVWLPRGVIGVLVLAALALAGWNPDAQIVRFNAAATQVDRLDLTYLGELSSDAVPAAAQLAEPARSRLLDRLPHAAPDGWASWNLSRANAAAIVGADATGLGQSRP
jgi:hypothetical protein